jgi:hypothetical protein
VSGKSGKNLVSHGAGHGLRPLGVEVDADVAVGHQSPEALDGRRVCEQHIVRDHPGLLAGIPLRAYCPVGAPPCQEMRITK